MPESDAGRNRTMLSEGDSVTIDYLTQHGNRTEQQGVFVMPDRENRTFVAKDVNDDRYLYAKRGSTALYSVRSGSSARSESSDGIPPAGGRQIGRFLSVAAWDGSRIVGSVSGDLSAFTPGSTIAVANRLEGDGYPVRLRYEAWGNQSFGVEVGPDPHEREMDVLVTKADRVVEGEPSEGGDGYTVTFEDDRPTLYIEGPDETEFIWTRGRYFHDQSLDLPDDISHEATLAEFESVLGRKTDDGYEPFGTNVAFYLPNVD